MATWGKGIANGFSFCALTGKKEIMEYGGIQRVGQPKVFLVSTTHGGETHAIAAGLATIDVFEKHDVIGHNHSIGDYFMAGAKAIIERQHLSHVLSIGGFNWSSFLTVKNANGEIDFGLRTLFMQEMIKHGVLYQGILAPCFSHTKEDIDLMLYAFDAACTMMHKGLEDGYEKHLIGNSVIKPVFRKLN
jgi:glutamate-1-semialdehyde aminotransferase